MKIGRNALVVTQLLLITPALLFLSALVVRELQSLQYEPARSAQQIVIWYAARLWTLWVLLLALPLSVLASGCISLLNGSSTEGKVSIYARRTAGLIHADRATRSMAIVTVSAALILVIVILHMLAN